MNTDSQIRTAVPEDADAFAQCVHAAFFPYIARIGQPPAPMLENYMDVIREHRVFVLDAGGQIAGVVVLAMPQHWPCPLLDTLAVHPHWQRRGFGAALIAFVEQQTRALGHRTIELYTQELMAENISLYRELGYEEYDCREDRGYRRVFMRKHLDRA